MIVLKRLRGFSAPVDDWVGRILHAANATPDQTQVPVRSAGQKCSSDRAEWRFREAAQTKYGPVFDVLMPRMAEIVASYSAVQKLDISNGIAEYTVNRTLDGVEYLFFIYFLEDGDGVWRIDSM